ncbi:hypothetical protein JVU11DRAFT_7579 [Chiua virens]|nr:hypothetical protein JVU11DRAFT_7579 [Chiua virens]
MSAPANLNGTVTPSHDVLYGGSINLVATTFVSGISWGFMTSLYAVCVHSLICNLRSRNASRKNVLLTAWVSVLWVLSSLSSFANAYCTLYAYSWQLDYPGGPFVYLGNEWSQPVPTLAFTTYVLTMCGVPSLARYLILSFMFVIYISVFQFGVTGSLTFVLNSSNQTLYSNLAEKAVIPFFTLSVTLNVLATAFIAIRLLTFKRLMERSLGTKATQKSPYTSIATMLIESSALYATWSLVYIIVYAVSNPGQNIMLMTLGNVQVIAPLLIVYRVSRGTAWEETTSAKFTSSSTRSRLVFSGYDSQGGSDTIIEHNSEHEELSDPTPQMIFASPSQVETKQLE